MAYWKTVAARPQRPVLVVRWQARRGLPRQSDALALWFPELAADQLIASVALIETDARVYCGAEAAVRSWARGPRGGWVVRLYQLPGCPGVAEYHYRQIAKRRQCLR